MGIVPEVFELDDDNYLHLLQDRPPEELRDECEQAMRQCPRQAISIHDR
jgi:ferredoxin